MKSNFLAATGILLAACLLVGCGTAGDGLTRFPVAGTVTFKGKPIEEGKLILLPATSEVGSGPTQVIPIVDGQFDGESTPGMKRVEFYASWPNGKMITLEDGRQVPDSATLPPECNVHSKHELEVKPEANTGLSWEL
ncbi:hypothetical protein AB1L30_10890 [Bremerella sp. JC817]|uniref:hypothetical protein n=1 Tax=Bremerella sp. JC817 TaxID=3231756 RepID=UPI003458C025